MSQSDTVKFTNKNTHAPTVEVTTFYPNASITTSEDVLTLAGVDKPSTTYRPADTTPATIHGSVFPQRKVRTACS